jgi:hypothetical protein
MSGLQKLDSGEPQSDPHYEDYHHVSITAHQLANTVRTRAETCDRTFQGILAHYALSASNVDDRKDCSVWADEHYRFELWHADLNSALSLIAEGDIPDEDGTRRRLEGFIESLDALQSNLAEGTLLVVIFASITNR